MDASIGEGHLDYGTRVIHDSDTLGVIISSEERRDYFNAMEVIMLRTVGNPDNP